MANVVYLSKTLLTGGTAPALDSIDGTGLVDGDFAHVTVAGVLYVYKLNATLGGAESIPTIIAPDTNPGNKRWVLQGVNANGLVDNSLTASLPVFTGASKEFVSKSVVDARTALGIGNKNIIINGGFTINQRVYISTATLAAGIYGHDRWKGGAGGGTYSFTQLNSPTTITIAANKTLIQVIEDKNVYGGTYILSWTGTCQARYAINSATPAGAYASSPIIIAGQTAGTTMSVEFGNGAASGTLGLVQLELGSVVTAFDFRPYAQELELCHRYYERLVSGSAYTILASGVVNGITSGLVGLVYKEKCLIPTINYSAITVYDASTYPAVTAIGSVSTGLNRSNVSFTAAGGGLTVGRGCVIQADNNTAAYIDFTAEL